MDPAILGVSAGDDGAQNAQDPPLISAAMENDRHFWAVHPLREDIVPVAGGDAGDWTGPHTDSRGPAAGSRKRKASGDALAFPGVAAAYEDEDEEADEGIPCEIAFAPRVVLSGRRLIASSVFARFCGVGIRGPSLPGTSSMRSRGSRARGLGQPMLRAPSFGPPSSKT
jgi:hypothetical protein